MCITIGTKLHPSCRCHDNTYAFGSALIKTQIRDFIVNKDFIHSAQFKGESYDNMTTMCVPSKIKRLQMEIFGFFQKETGAKSVLIVATT